jgi:hypothetical protein
LHIYRFAGFTREYITFLIDHKRFSQGFLEWIQLNEENIATYGSAPGSHKFSLTGLKIYSDIFKQLIKEKLNYVFLIFYWFYRELAKQLSRNTLHTQLMENSHNLKMI